jgi:hypothetical protein
MLQKTIPSVLPTMYQEKNTFYKAWIMFLMAIYQTINRYLVTPVVWIYSSSALLIGNGATVNKCGHTAAQHDILRKMYESKNMHVIIPVRNISMLSCDPRKHI